MERKINAAAFKARCLALIDEVADRRRARKKLSVREKPRTLLGATKGTFRILGDIVGPIVDEWDDPVTDRARAKARKGGKGKMRRQDARS